MANLAAPSAWTPSPARPDLGQRLSRLGYALLAYTVLVLLFGALVRVTGSGAGCGQHWPTCQGEILHLPRSFETVLELSHRVTSGLVLVFGLGFAWLTPKAPDRAPFAQGHLGGHLLRAARRAHRRRARPREAGRREHFAAPCADDADPPRQHLWAHGRVRTLGVLGDRDGRSPSPARGTVRSALFAFLGAFVLVAAMGAVTALGDTLYPVSASSLAGRMGEDLGTSSHFLQQLRVVHPLLAVCFGLAVIFLLPRVTRLGGALAQRFATASVALAMLELGLGVLNVVLSAPAWMQLVHLGAAVVLWLALVLTAAEMLAPRRVLELGPADR